jgi:hypothetical protein
MADADSAQKRFSIVGLDAPWPAFLPVATGTVTQAERQHFLRKYSGILFGGSTGYGLDDLTTILSFHLATLLPGEQSDDLRTYANAVRGTTGEDDLNTAIWVDLNF